MTERLVVNEVYLSVQGESSWSGLPCIFIRLTGCDLRCSYCDTAYAFTEGNRVDFDELLARIQQLAAPFRERGSNADNSSFNLPLVELTGGEPLLQRQTPALVQRLIDSDYEVLIETSGAHDISKVTSRARRIMDLKVPSSGESHRMDWDNMERLTSRDEVKFVIATLEDYEWAVQVLRKYELPNRCEILFSLAEALRPEQRVPSLKPEPNADDRLSRSALVERLIQDHVPARFQLQAHKFIWDPAQRGV